MAHAHPSSGASLRAGWYPDPDGMQCYRLFDGQLWTDATRDVPSSQRQKFAMQQQALQRKLGAASSRGAHLRAVPGGRMATDPGRKLGIWAFWVTVLVSVLVGVFMAISSSRASRAAGYPRSGWVTASYALGALQLVVVVGALVLALVAPNFSSKVAKPASAVTATAAVKSTVDGIEACAANVPDGTYRGCVGARSKVARACRPTRPAAGAVCADPIGVRGYVVRSTSKDDVLFVERHAPNGNLTKSCAPVGSPGCATGRW